MHYKVLFSNAWKKLCYEDYGELKQYSQLQQSDLELLGW